MRDPSLPMLRFLPPWRSAAVFDPATLTASTVLPALIAGGGAAAAGVAAMNKPSMPTPPTPTPPPLMPDPNSPENLAARKSAMTAAMSAGRASTTLTGTAPLAAGGLYGGTKAGG